MRFRHLLRALVFLPFLTAVAHAEPTVLRVGGSGGALCLMSALAETYGKTRPDVRFVFMPSIGTTGGIKAVAAGVLDIGLASRALKDTERTDGIMAHLYGRTPFVFAVQTSNPASAATLAQLTDIYLGKTTEWSDSSRLRLIMRPKNDSDTEALRRMSPGLDEAVTMALSREGMIVANTDRDSVDAIAKTPGAIGTSTLAQLICEKRPLKALAVDGVTPSFRSLRDGQYPYQKSLYVVTARPAPKTVSEFIQFLHSPRSQAMLAELGVIPMEAQ